YLVGSSEAESMQAATESLCLLSQAVTSRWSVAYNLERHVRECSRFASLRVVLIMNFRNLLFLGAMAAAFGSSAIVSAEQKVKLDKIEVPAGVGRSKHLGHMNPKRVLHLAVSMPFGDADAMQKFADSVSDPASPNYR